MGTCAWGYSEATLPRGFIQMVDWTSRLRVRQQADKPVTVKSQLSGNLICGLRTFRLSRIELGNGKRLMR